LERGTRRLLFDLQVMGRVSEDRTSAWERLQRELGPTMARKLLPTRRGGRSARRRDVA
jgi:hypothetical protein